MKCSVEGKEGIKRTGKDGWETKGKEREKVKIRALKKLYGNRLEDRRGK